MAKPPLLFMRKIILRNKYHETIEYSRLICNFLLWTHISFPVEQQGSLLQSNPSTSGWAALLWNEQQPRQSHTWACPCTSFVNQHCMCMCVFYEIHVRTGRQSVSPTYYRYLFQINTPEMFSWHTAGSLNLQSGSDSRFCSLFPACSATLLHSPLAPESLLQSCSAAFPNIPAQPCALGPVLGLWPRNPAPSHELLRHQAKAGQRHISLRVLIITSLH